MLVLFGRRREIGEDLARLLCSPRVPRSFRGWWPYRLGVAWVAGHNLPARPAEALALMNATVAAAPQLKRRSGRGGGPLKWAYWHYSLS